MEKEKLVLQLTFDSEKSKEFIDFMNKSYKHKGLKQNPLSNGRVIFRIEFIDTFEIYMFGVSFNENQKKLNEPAPF